MQISCTTVAFITHAILLLHRIFARKVDCLDFKLLTITDVRCSKVFFFLLHSNSSILKQPLSGKWALVGAENLALRLCKIVHLLLFLPRYFDLGDILLQSNCCLQTFSLSEQMSVNSSILLPYWMVAYSNVGAAHKIIITLIICPRFLCYKLICLRFLMIDN